MISVRYIELQDNRVLKVSLFNNSEYNKYHSLLWGEVSEIENMLSYDNFISKTEKMINPYLQPMNLMFTPFVLNSEAVKLFDWHLLYFNKGIILDEIKKSYGYSDMKYIMLESIDKKQLNGTQSSK